MSDGGVIMISSDEDPDSVKVSEEKKCINNTDAVQTSVKKLQNNRANGISSLNFASQSDHTYTIPVETTIPSRSFDTTKINFSSYESDTFKQFLRVALQAEGTEDDKDKIREKLNKYCQVADPSYIRSPEFNEILEKGISRITEDPVFLYFVLKEVKDCLLSHKVESRSVNNTEDEMVRSGENAPEISPQGNSSESDDLEGVDNEERKKVMVEKLTSLLKNINQKIKESEELEVDFSDEENSNYIKMQRYREKFCEVYEKLCKYTNKPLDGNRVGGVKKINFAGTSSLELNRAIEKWLNETQQFPDYCDVNNVMIELNQSLNLNLTKEEIETKAQEVFENIGNRLQRRRHFDLWDSLSSFLGTEFDPAVRNPELQCVLKQNFELGKKKEEELLNHYAEMQEKEQTQPLEESDEEADCSPEENDYVNDQTLNLMEYMMDSKTPTEDDDHLDDNYNNGDNDSNDDHDNGNGNDNDNDNEYEYDGGSDETGNDESECSSQMVVQPETLVQNNDPERISVADDNCEQMDDVGSKGIDSHVPVNSVQTETVETNIGTIPVKKESTVSAIPNKQDTDDNLVVCKSENFMKRKNENLNDSDNVNIHPCKKFLEEKEMTETRNLKETEIINKSDSDSDCEIIEIVSIKEGNTSKDLSLNRKMHQVNYAFINNNFNYNTVLSSNVVKKTHCFTSNYKNMKNQKPSQDFPPNESTDIKTTEYKNALPRENKGKRKSKNVLNKPKSLSTVTSQTSKDSDLKNNELALSTGTNSINCSMHQEKSGENMNSQKEVNKTNQNNDSEQGSSNETAAPPIGGSSSGGNGEDNSENNGNKKPSDRETQTEDNPENEDQEEDEEEGADNPEKNQPGTSKVIEAAPKLIISRTNQKQQKVSGAAVFKPPPTEKVAPMRRNSLGKQGGKPPGSEIMQGKEPLNSTPTARSPRARAPPVRKRKTNQNGGIQGTPRQGKSNVFTFQFQKGPAELKKPNVKRAIPTATTTSTASSSRDDDVEIIQVTKKKRATPVKPVQSDEEIVKNFLERSHPSISITTPKKKTVQKEPPASVRQALETLSRLKGISATIVKGSSKHSTDEEVTIIGESLNPRVNKISKQQKPQASTSTAAMPPSAALPPPVATATASLEPLLPQIVTVQGNVQGFDDMGDDGPAIQDNLPQNYVQIPQVSLVNVTATTSSTYNEHSYNAQAHLAVSATSSNLNEHSYNAQAHLANVSGNGSYHNENFYSPEAPVATASGSASTSQENLYGPQAPAASISGNASTYEENFTGKVECVPIPRFRNVRSRSRRTPKKTKEIECITLD